MLQNALKKVKKMVQNAPGLYKFHQITPDRLSEFPNGIEQIRNREFDGFLVKNFLSQDEVQKLISEFRKIQEPEYVKTPVGGVFPRNFQQVFELIKNDPEDVAKSKQDAYFKQCEDYYRSFESRFGVDFASKIEAVLKGLGGDRQVEVPTGVDDQGIYAFTTFRCLNPERGEMGFHTGNLFRDIYSKFYEHLETHVDSFNQLSFFVLLQKPESGGTLSLYDIEWKAGQTKFEDRYVLDTDGRKRDIDSFDRKIMCIDPSPGDMVLFNGAQIWHRVEFVHGKSDRITIGGFFAFSKDKKKIMYWS